VIHAAVAALQGKAPFQGLDVVKCGFRVDGEAPIGPADRRVPGAEVAIDRQRYLGGPSQARMYSRLQSFEESGLSSVTDRIASRVGPKPQVQPDGCRDRRKGPDVNGPGQAALDPTFRRARDAAGGANRVLTQAGIASRRGDIGTNPPIVLGDPTTRSIRDSGLGSHGPAVCCEPLCRRLAGPSIVIHAASAANDEHRPDIGTEDVDFARSHAVCRTGRFKWRPEVAPAAVCRARRRTGGLGS
jgi:hypothetical protein